MTTTEPTNADLYLRNNGTGDIVLVRVNWPEHRYCWVDGNFSCDCNRMLFWCRALGTAEPDHVDCGETAFSIAHIVMDDGSDPEAFT